MKDSKKLIIRIICSVLAVLLLVWLILPIIEAGAIATNVELKVDGTDCIRDDGDLIVYTNLFGKTTNTNQWGYEATIVDGVCVKVAYGGNSEIPSNGFVISGHNSSKDGARQNSDAIADYISVGKYVAFNKHLMLIVISDTPIEVDSEYSLQTTISGTNRARGANELIIYNNGKTTNTNEWGYEITVENGLVVSMGGNDSTVPSGKNSFVVSAHGTAADWIKLNVVEGMKAEIVSDQLVFTYGYSTMVYDLGKSKVKLQETYQQAIDCYMLIDRNKAQKATEDAISAIDLILKDYEESGDKNALSDQYENVQEAITYALGCCQESSQVEYRGVWLRPTQKTKEDVEDYVERLYQSGINLICIETLYDGYMIMPMPSDSLFEQNPNWKGFDMLQAFIDACHERNMDLHIWLPTYYVGHEPCSASVAAKKPEWVLKDNNGQTLSDTDGEGAFLMLDPANKEVKDYLLSQYRYILDTYEIDGFELDYIRYYGRSTVDYGYTASAIKDFQDKYGVTPTFDQSASWWNDWCQMRCDYVTDMVRSVRALIDEVAPDVLLTADVVPIVNTAKEYVYQDYAAWLEEGLLDVIHPMCYDEGYDSYISQLNELCGTHTLLCVGLGAYVKTLSAETLEEQTVTVNKLGGNGSVYFEATTYFAKNLSNKLIGVYAQRAVTPTSSNAIEKQLEQITRRLDYFVESGLITESVKQSILSSLDAETAVRDIGDEYAASLLKNDITTYQRLKAIEYIAPEPDESAEQSEEVSTQVSETSTADIDTDDQGIIPILPFILIPALLVLIILAVVYRIVLKKKQ